MIHVPQWEAALVLWVLFGSLLANWVVIVHDAPIDWTELFASLLLGPILFCLGCAMCLRKEINRCIFRR